MGSESKIRQFFFPSLTPRFLIRVSFVALGAYLFFSNVLIPIHIKGTSMEPTYHDGTLIFARDSPISSLNPKGPMWSPSDLLGTR